MHMYEYVYNMHIVQVRRGLSMKWNGIQTHRSSVWSMDVSLLLMIKHIRTILGGGGKKICSIADYTYWEVIRVWCPPPPSPQLNISHSAIEPSVLYLSSFTIFLDLLFVVSHAFQSHPLQLQLWANLWLWDGAQKCCQLQPSRKQYPWMKWVYMCVHVLVFNVMLLCFFHIGLFSLTIFPLLLCLAGFGNLRGNMVRLASVPLMY